MKKTENWKAHLFVVAIVVLVMPVVLAGFLLWLATRAPMATPRAYKAPTPNAYDYYVSAAASIDNTNFFGLRRGSSNRSMSFRGGRMFEAPLEQKDAVLARNAKALAIFDKAIAHDCLVPRTSNRSSMFAYSSFGRFRNLVWLKCLESQSRAGHKDWSAAADSALDVIKMGEDMRRGSNVRESRSGLSNQSSGRSELAAILDNLDSKQAIAASRRLESIRGRHVPFTEILREEKWFTLALMDYMWKRPNDDNNYGSRVAGAAPLALSVPSSAIGKIMNRIQMRGVLKDLDGFTSLSRKSFADAKPVVMSATQVRRQPQAASSAIVNYGTHWCNDLTSEALNSVLNVMLALRAYKLDHGVYPAKLDDLAPKYIGKIPSDPFARSGQLRYSVTPKRYVLYSIGPDCRDDGGRPIVEPNYGGRSYYGQYRVQTDSVLDIVAGINTK